MVRVLINPAKVARPIGQYSHVAKVSANKFLFIAGQVAVDKYGKVVGKGDFVAQAHQVFKNLKAIFTSEGLTFDNVVAMNTYVTDMRNRAKLAEVRPKYMKTFPPNTLVAVKALALPELLLEVEAIAATD